MGLIITLDQIRRMKVRTLERPPEIGARLMPQHLHWQVGRYKEVGFRVGPGGVGRMRRWVVDQEGEQHNLILDQAYDTLIAQSGFVALTSYAAVGTGSTAPSPSDSGLVNEVARTNAQGGGSDNVSRVSPGLYEVTRYREFTEAQVGGRNLTEWGFSPSSTAGANLAVRELFRDGDGNPVVLTLASDQRLRLIYKHQVQLGPIQAPFSINIDGYGTMSGTAKLFRRYEIGIYSYQTMDIDLANRWATGGNIYIMTDSDGNANWGYDDNTANWDSNTLLIKQNNPSAYVSGSRQRVLPPLTWAANEANYNISRFGVSIYNAGFPAAFQLFPSTPFPKSSLYKLTLNEWTLTWGP